MALSAGQTSSWLQRLEFSGRLFETGRNDYELYDGDERFVLNVEMPGSDPGEISVTWDSGALEIAAEHEDEQRSRRRAFDRRFRFPKDVGDEAIAAEYTKGTLEVWLPVRTSATVTGTEIEVQV